MTEKATVRARLEPTAAVVRTAIPYTDADTAAAVEAALRCLLACRGAEDLGDAGDRLSLLVSLLVETDSRLPDTVADARAQGCTWDEIATAMASTVPAVRHRYAAHVRWRRTCPL